MKLDNKNIFCSVSAGYSSVIMAVKIREWYPDHNIIFGMANTSKEREESLEFMDKCDKYFGLNMTWIEAIINPEKGKGTDFKITDFENLKRKGEIFEDGIKVYGIPSVANKWCNRELKLIPMTKYCDSIFGKNNYSVAVGLRSDESHRVRKDYLTNNVFYPLMDHNIDSNYRNKFWHNQPIKITIPAYKGNCDVCFEKSNRKIMTILEEEPDRGNWWQSMIDKYGTTKKEGKDSYNELMEQNGKMTFYRKYKSINDLIDMAKKPFAKYHDEYKYTPDLFDVNLDYEEECGSGCSVF